ncbi:hypothetical protein EHV15_34880 [Paenibacillus oralis]|uniref:Uncharacterized protein n=1 Tax=Paenibacillus oralis TaxID=2490856 RepID=A0A3P3TCF6_9BACL|nr:hypothetical protein [Paenibacillus oralis]RRJ54778.1 hypothetical protein EHV15_34880 [Paenibacillus oralis]
MTPSMNHLQSYLTSRKDTMLRSLNMLERSAYLDDNGMNFLPDSILESGKLNINRLDLCLSFKGYRLEQIIEDVRFIQKSYSHLFTEAELHLLNNYTISIRESFANITEIINFRKEQISLWKEELADAMDGKTTQSEQPINLLLQLLSIDDQQCVKLMEELNAFQRSENLIKDFTVKIWKEQLTSPHQYQEGQPFKFVAHCLTQDINFLEDETISQPLLSASLLTEKHLGTYRYNYGFIYPVNFDNLFLISKADLYSNIFETENSAVDFFYHEHIGENQILMFTDQRSTKTMTPEQVELDCLNRTQAENGELLNYDNRRIYSEILLYNNEANRRLAVFCIISGDRYYNGGFIRAREIADKLKLDLLVIDKAIYRERLGLTCLTEKEHQDIIEKLTSKCIELSLQRDNGNHYDRMRNEIRIYAESPEGKWNPCSLMDFEIHNIYQKSRSCKSEEEFNDCLLHEMTVTADKYRALNRSNSNVSSFS